MPDASDQRAGTKLREPRSLSADRIEELRARINVGMYLSESILQATARAILERGDL